MRALLQCVTRPEVCGVCLARPARADSCGNPGDGLFGNWGRLMNRLSEIKALDDNWELSLRETRGGSILAH